MKNSLSYWIKALRWPIRLFVTSKLIPKDPCSELDIDLNKPIMYVLKSESATDLLALENICRKLNLPSPTQDIVLNGTTFKRYFCVQGRKTILIKQEKNEKFINRFSELIHHLRQSDQQNVQLVPVSLFWGRDAGHSDKSMASAVLTDEHASWLRKMMMVIFLGRDNFVRFSLPISMDVLVEQRGSDDRIAHKLSRLARVHFHRQTQAMLGPKLLYRASLDRKILQSQALIEVMDVYAAEKNISKDKVTQEVHKIIDEIAANYSQRLLRVFDRVLTWLWNKLYKGVSITHAERVRQLAQDGDEIVFVPCHRSHMDYLLLSYVIYRQGMVPPHIAAGINLSFWPAGPILRRGGAFFMRRTFKGNKLYAAVFREYLHQLFNNGYSVKYFTEGGRSRTGRLLNPKTGMVAMTVQGLLRGIDRPITLVPVYLGYDHVMEVSSYHGELKGQSKEKESVGQILKTLRKLKNFGRAYVNFGEPISLNKYLDNHVENWKDAIDPISVEKPTWLSPTVNGLANNIMVNINNSAAVSAITLSALVLLGAERRVLTKDALIAQLDLYMSMLRHAQYHSGVTLPDANGAELYQRAVELDKFTISKDELGEVVSLDTSSAVSMTYYRNNILHLFAVPSLVATAIIYQGCSSRAQINQVIDKLFPLIKNELFIGLDSLQLSSYLDSIIDSMLETGLIEQVEDTFQVVSDKKPQLLIMAHHIQETLERYTIVLKIMEKKPHIEGEALRNDSHALAKRLSSLHGINAPEFFDKSVLATFISGLKEYGYINDEVNGGYNQSTRGLTAMVSGLLRPKVLVTIRSSLN